MEAVNDNIGFEECCTVDQMKLFVQHCMNCHAFWANISSMAFSFNWLNRAEIVTPFALESSLSLL